VGPMDEGFGIRLQQASYKMRCAHDSYVHHWQSSSLGLSDEEEPSGSFQNNRKADEQSSGAARKSSVGRTVKHTLRQDIFDPRSSKGTVIILPSIGWNVVLFQRPHHLARAFVQQGYRVIFDCSNSSDDIDGIKEIEPNLYLFKGDSEQLASIPDSLLWTFTYNYHQKSAFPAETTTIYDWIDDLEIFPYDPDLLHRNHQSALREATVVACVSRRLHEQALAVCPDAIYLPNGVENWRFDDDSAPIPNDSKLDYLLRQDKPIAGYYGALANWFDYDLLDEVARLRRDWIFLLIGPNHDQSINGHSLLARPNAAWLGPREYRLLPGYLRCFDVATIPFVINNITLAVSPLKLFEYFAGGKPVITTPMPDCEAFPEVNIVRSSQEFTQVLDHAYVQGQDPRFRQHLRQIARENSWVARVKTVIERLKKTG
jgi:teichuronic acid biosynthesis glycosyltransferase TuaH